MKTIAIFIIVLLLITPITSADSSWNPITIGENMVSDGISGAFENIADEIMELICSSPDDDEDSDEEKHGTVTTLIIKFATWGVTPFEYPTIQRVLGTSFAVGIGMLITYFFIGSAGAAITGRLGDYGKNSMYGILLMSFSPLLIWIVLLFAKVLKTMMMESIADSIAPASAGCVALYFMMALMWLLVAIFFGISNIVICLTAALSFVLGGLYAFEKTRHAALWGMDYFVTMVVMQVMVVLVAVVVVGVVNDIQSSEYWYTMSGGMDVFTYAGMILLILIMCACMTFGKALVMKTVKKALMLVI